MAWNGTLAQWNECTVAMDSINTSNIKLDDLWRERERERENATGQRVVYAMNY